MHLNQSKSSNDPTKTYEHSCQITFTLMQNLSFQRISINVCARCTPVSISTSHEVTRKVTSLHRSCLGRHKIYTHLFFMEIVNVFFSKSSNSSCKNQLQSSCSCSFISFKATFQGISWRNSPTGIWGPHSDVPWCVASEATGDGAGFAPAWRRSRDQTTRPSRG